MIVGELAVKLSDHPAIHKVKRYEFDEETGEEYFIDVERMYYDPDEDAIIIH